MSNIAGQQSIKDIYNLLETNDLNVIEETVALIRDGINSSPDPWLLFGLEYYITTGNDKARELLSCVRQNHHKILLIKLDEYLQKTNARMRALNILSDVNTKEPVWIYEVADSKIFITLIKLISTENDIVCLTVTLYNIVILLPKVPTKIGAHLKNLFRAYVRLVSWESKKHAPDISELNLAQLKSAVYAYFLCLYGMYPNSFTTFLQEYFAMRVRSTENKQLAASTSNDMTATDMERNNTFHKYVLPMLQQVRMHPKLVYYTRDMEVSKEKWRKMEPHDVLADIAEVCLDPTEQMFHDNEVEEHDSVNVTSEREAVKTFSQILAQGSNCALSDSKPRLIDTAATLCQPSSTIWSPSMMLGLSTPPASRSISPAPGTDNNSSPRVENKHTNDHLPSVEKVRPSSLNFSGIRSKEGSLQSTPCEKSPSKLSKFDFSIKSQSATNTPTKSGLGKSSDFRLSLQHSFSEQSPDNEDNEVNKISFASIQEDANKSAEESFVNISYQNSSCDETKLSSKPNAVMNNALNHSALNRADATIASAHDALELLNISQTKAVFSPNEILDLHMKLAAETTPEQLVQQQCNGSWPTFSNPEDEIKSLKTALLQMHCSMLFERHKRQQHTVRGRRLKRKVYESVALEEKNIALTQQLSQKDEEMSQLKLLVKEHANTIKKRSEEYKRDCQKLQNRMKEFSSELQFHKQENARLQMEKISEQNEIDRLKNEIKTKDNELNKNKLLLETQTHDKAVIDKLTEQVMTQQKELLVVGELSNKVSDLTDFSTKHKAVKEAEYNMMKDTYEHTLSNIRNEMATANIKLTRAENKLGFLEEEVKKKTRLLEEQKKYLENVKSLARWQMKSLEDKYQSQKAITGRSETYAMELFAKLTAIDGSGEYHPYSANRMKPIQTNSTALTAVASLSGQAFGISPQLSPPIRPGVIKEADSGQ